MGKIVDEDGAEIFGPDGNDFVDSEIETDVEDEVVLAFKDDFDDLDFADAEKLAHDKLGEYSIEDLLILNEMPEAEAVAILFHQGMLGLPMSVEEYEEDEVETVQDLSDEEAD